MCWLLVRSGLDSVHYALLSAVAELQPAGRRTTSHTDLITHPSLLYSNYPPNINPSTYLYLTTA